MRGLKLVTMLVLAGSLGLLGCQSPVLGPLSGASETRAVPVTGRVSFDVPTRRVQATLGEVANQATVSLIDPTTGNTLSSSVTDASGNFVLAFSNFTPVPNRAYILEAVKGLSMGGAPNRIGAPAVRVRTMLFWNGGWQSFTNTVPGAGISVSMATTALATIVSLKQSAGVSLTLANLVGTISGASFNETGTGLSNASDFTPVLGLVSNAVTLDHDPVAAISLDPSTGNYVLATGAPFVSRLTPSSPVPGGTLTCYGSDFETLSGRYRFWLGDVAIASWSVSSDRSSLTLNIPANAYAAALVMQQPDGTHVMLSSMLKVKGTVGTFVGSLPGPGNVDGMGWKAQFKNPYGLVYDPARAVFYATDMINGNVRRITLDGQVTTLAGSGAGSDVDGTGLAASFNHPMALGIDSVGNLYVPEFDGHHLRRVTPSGGVTTLLQNGTWGDASGATPVTFNNLVGAVVDPAGNVYVSDYSANCIYKVAANGALSLFAGAGTPGTSDGATTSAQFKGPGGLALDSSGNLYVADIENSRLRRIVGGTVQTLLAAGTWGDQGGQAVPAFTQPYCLLFDPNGNLFISDTFDNQIKELTSGGSLKLVAGSGIQACLDGATTSAQFALPIGMAMDASGSLYVSDERNSQIRVVVP